MLNGQMKFDYGLQMNDEEDSTTDKDFLFNLVLSLVVVLSYFANKQVSERFALAEGSGVPGALTQAEYADLPKTAMPKDGSCLVSFEGQDIHSIEQLKSELSQQQPREVLFTPSSDLPYGKVERVKNVFKAAGFDLAVEYKKLKSN